MVASVEDALLLAGSIVAGAAATLKPASTSLVLFGLVAAMVGKAAPSLLLSAYWKYGAHTVSRLAVAGDACLVALAGTVGLLFSSGAPISDLYSLVGLGFGLKGAFAIAATLTHPDQQTSHHVPPDSLKEDSYFLAFAVAAIPIALFVPSVSAASALTLVAAAAGKTLIPQGSGGGSSGAAPPATAFSGTLEATGSIGGQSVKVTGTVQLTQKEEAETPTSGKGKSGAGRSTPTGRTS